MLSKRSLDFVNILNTVNSMQSFKADELAENPRETAGILSSLTFTMPTFFKGCKRVLNEGDLYQVLKEHKSSLIGHKLNHAWEVECKKQKHKKNGPSLLKVLLKVFGGNFILLAVGLVIMELGLKISQPLFLGKLVAAYSKVDDVNNDTETYDIYLYALGVILTNAFNVFIVHPNMMGLMHLGMKIRIALCSLIYRKALRLSKTALGHTTTGQILNLMSNDVGRFDTSIFHLHYLWIGPLQVIIVTYLVYREIGISSIFGVAVMVLFVPLQMFLGKKASNLRLLTALRTDERVRMMTEILNGIQVIKMYAWEIPFSKMVQYCRQKEMGIIRYVNYIRGVMLGFIIFLTRFSIFASLVSYVLLGSFISAEKAFVITAYYNTLRVAMTVFFPAGITQFAETWVSIKRLQKYMLLEETNLSQKSLMQAESKGLNVEDTFPFIYKPRKNSGVIIENLSAKWDPNSIENTLETINLHIKPKCLVAVIGPVGAGKSSLIQTILGELPTANSDSVRVDGVISYASQEPWLFTGTVRQNILFGLRMDRQRYRTVIRKCALERDFELLPYGDRTVVGERGASLSGGQKARINLARAVYRQADIYLLDDPLSAVDSHVARHLFDQCMRNYLSEKIVILVTHQLQFLEQADLIVIMDQGRITAKGTFESMSQSGLDFAKLLSHTKEEDVGDTISLRSAEERLSSKYRKDDSFLRQTSITSRLSLTESASEEVPKQVEESREEGKIGWKLYHKYFKASGSYLMVVAVIYFCVSSQILASAGDYYLVNKNEGNPFDITETTTTDRIDIYIFTGLTLGLIMFTLIRTFLFFGLAMRSSTNLHNDMFVGITRAPMYFFNTNPSGRILNRFSKDLGQVDEILPNVMLDVIQIFLSLTGILIVLCLINPWYILATGITGVIFYFLRSFYLKTSRDVKRLEGVARSPIYTHLSASLNGLATVRAFGAEQILISEFDNYQDLHSASFYMFLTTSRAFGYWLDCWCVLYLAVITLSFFLFDAGSSGDVGLAITQAMGMTGMVQWGMRQSAELENTMTSVERVVDYGTIQPEGELETQSDKKPSQTWPEKGHIVLENLSLRYSPEPKSETVLKSLNLEIKPGEKIGIVGRTGAGKSSLINALFRLSYTDGSVIIDQLNTNDLGLHDLRKKISIIPQEPVLFSGSMRYNLDPFNEYSDEKLWKALEEVKLKQAIAEMPQGLLSTITESGQNFSVGQRQMVCLARAILRENRILVMDEATANVDPQTDALVQITIRQKFRDCTVLTIAHRLNTIMDSDKVLVMDAGRAVEFAAPYELLTESRMKIFYNMVKQTGQTNFENLLKIAHVAYESHSRKQCTYSPERNKKQQQQSNVKFPLL
uniref:Multidrug resistance-associated protein lethal(2)03659 n=1 Tax=Glossina brevipalpis TaxID=37001 RepID=A0A1A9X4D6_9MUSC